MNNKLSALAIALSATFLSANVTAIEVDWVAGKTKVTNGDTVNYLGECYTAQHNPGTWETPSPAASWFWSPTACSGETTPPVCSETQELVDGSCIDIITPPICNETQELIDGSCVDIVIPPVCNETQELIDGSCVDIVVPPICNENQELVNNECIDKTIPPATDATPWVAGKTKVSNGDIVLYQSSCFEAKNSPGTWETPKASSWFWTETNCPSTEPALPVNCPEGSTAPTLAECPPEVIEPVVCPDGSTAATIAECLPEVIEPVVCPDGSTVATIAECPPEVIEPVICPDGSTVATIAECPPEVIEPVICPDGSTAPTIAECPPEVIEPVICPDGSSAPSFAECAATEVSLFVSPEGNDNHDGSASTPLKTLKKALTKAKAGDVIELGAGTYKTAQVIDKINGTTEAPIVIRGNGATFDGTIDINSEWTVHSGNIYKTQINENIWQLFVGSEMVMSARWPNAQIKDASLWDMKKSWRHQAPASSFGNMIDERPYQSIKVKTSGNVYEQLPAGINTQSLADSGIDATGAIAIMNLGSWLNWAQVVSEHTPGTSNFTYSTDFSGSGTAMKNAANNMLSTGTFWANKNGKYEEGHYYLEGKLELLDSENEWFFDKNDKTVYLWAPNNVDPNTLQVRGKNQTYGLTVRNSSNVIIEGVDFFATAFTVISSQDITFKDIDAKYYAYSQRLLGDLTRPQTIKFISNNKAITQSRNNIIDSYLAYTDGPAFEMIKESGNVVNNNLIHDIDYSNLGTGGEGSLNMASQSRNISFTNNTFHTAGNSEGVRVGAASKVLGNHIYNTSLLQHDGAAINVGIDEQAGTEIAYNWVHDAPKGGIRFDGVEGAAKTGKDGLVHHNVVWNTDFSIIKGDTQGTYNNVMFNNKTTDLIIFNKESAGGLNYSSETFNNLVGELQGRKSGNAEQLAVPGFVENNITGNSADILSHLNGALWGDFRPKENSKVIDAGSRNSNLMTLDYLGGAPDIGAYEAADLAPWVPGHHGERASNPVPFNNVTNVALNLDLMFTRNDSKYDYQVYLGESKNALNGVGLTDDAYSVTELKPNTQYFWRVDVMKGGVHTTGQVWSFTTQP